VPDRKCGANSVVRYKCGAVTLTSFLCHFPLFIDDLPLSVPAKYYSINFNAFCCISNRTAGYFDPMDGDVAQWLERRSHTGELSLASARSVADV